MPSARPPTLAMAAFMTVPMSLASTAPVSAIASVTIGAVFGSAIGTPMDPANFVRREFRTAITAANEERAEKELEPIPAIRWHDLRHFAVSMLIAQRADILTLARIAGHADPNVTLKVYGHLMRGAISEAADLYDPLSEASGG